jgi:prevent-host-death family protein
MNKTIGIADAKAHLSEVIARVEAGETIVISRNGTPVAEVRPIRHLSPSEAVARIRELGSRIAKRNAGKPPWPEGRTLRQEMHADDRA